MKREQLRIYKRFILCTEKKEKKKQKQKNIKV